MIYPPTSFENKIGFASVRAAVKAKCLSPMGADICDRITFSSDFAEVEQKLLSTAEMLSIIRSAEGDRLPLGQAGDVRSMVSAIRIPGTFPAADELPVLRSTLQADRKSVV